MKEVKKTNEYSIFQKNSGRYCIQDPNGNWINGKHKSEILYAEKLIKTAPPKAEAPKVEAPKVEVVEEPQKEAS